jgi:3-oxoacyl-[acyl-carrier protein] reductase
VRGYTLAVAHELRDKGIKVTVICPDAVQTPMLDLQVDYEQAALTFSGSRSLSTQEVVDAILDRALVKAPIEITLPAARGFVSKIASFLPGLSALMLGSLQRRGRQQQDKVKNRR